MTTLLRPRHGAGGQVDARGYTLDCCALEHRLLFSATPVDPTMFESLESIETPLNSFSHRFAAENGVPSESDLVIDLDQIPNDAITHQPLIDGLDSWIVDGAAELEDELFDLSDGSPIKVSLNHGPQPVDEDAAIDVGAEPRGVENEYAGVDFSGGDPPYDIIVTPTARAEVGTSTLYDVQPVIDETAVSEAQTDIKLTDVPTSLAIPRAYDIDRSFAAVFENAMPGTLVGLTVNATGVNLSNVVRYELIEDADGRFTVDALTGVVSVANGLLLNREADPWHVIEVQATMDDGANPARASS